VDLPVFTICPRGVASVEVDDLELVVELLVEGGVVGGAEAVSHVVLVHLFGGSGFLGVGDPLKVIHYIV